jgi:methyl-accepting chemotaxis protein
MNFHQALVGGRTNFGARRMSWLNNFKIVYKVGLIVALLAMVMVGLVSFAVSKIKAADDAYSDVIARVDKYTTLAARGARQAENYVAAAFQLATETTDEGNVKYLAATAADHKQYES